MENATPELVIGLVGPIGVDLDMVNTQLADALRSVRYTPVTIRLTDLMRRIDVPLSLDDGPNPVSHYHSRIDYANAVREKCDDDSALAALAISAIREHREETHVHRGTTFSASTIPADVPLEAHAYILRQLKRPEEIELLRQVYGRKFVQISVSLDASSRKSLLANRIETRDPSLSPEKAEEAAKGLIERDLNESAALHGQRIEEVFHLGDVFVSARSEELAAKTVKRFVDAFFGRNSISPSYDEYGAYMAASASLRSIDTSRQVGAALFTKSGEIVTLGSNEVPAAGGGTYWSDHPEPHRDFDDGQDANNLEKRRIAFDFVQRLRAGGFLTSDGSDQALFSEIMETEQASQSRLMDITEFGRMAHAEMNAVLDAARLGRPTKGATLYCTTFPCHNCAKHIVAAGIERVVFIQPYQKSAALNLHGDAIALEEKVEGRVLFEHFVGISPRRYRDIFEKGRRRRQDGTMEPWYEGTPAPRIEDRSPYYVYKESDAMFYALQTVAEELGLTLDQDSDSEEQVRE